MPRVRIVLACFLSILMLLFSIQLYVDAVPEYRLDQRPVSGYEIHASCFNLLASTSQKQESDSNSKRPASFARFSFSYKIRILTDFALKNSLTGFIYCQYSGMIIPSVRTSVMIFPFHFFG
jgi:hypothetical protein